MKRYLVRFAWLFAVLLLIGGGILYWISQLFGGSVPSFACLVALIVADQDLIHCYQRANPSKEIGRRDRLQLIRGTSVIAVVIQLVPILSWFGYEKYLYHRAMQELAGLPAHLVALYRAKLMSIPFMDMMDTMSFIGLLVMVVTVTALLTYGLQWIFLRQKRFALKAS